MRTCADVISRQEAASAVQDNAATVQGGNDQELEPDFPAAAAAALVQPSPIADAQTHSRKATGSIKRHATPAPHSNELVQFRGAASDAQQSQPNEAALLADACTVSFSLTPPRKHIEPQRDQHSGELLAGSTPLSTPRSTVSQATSCSHDAAEQALESAAERLAAQALCSRGPDAIPQALTRAAHNLPAGSSHIEPHALPGASPTADCELTPPHCADKSVKAQVEMPPATDTARACVDWRSLSCTTVPWAGQQLRLPEVASGDLIKVDYVCGAALRTTAGGGFGLPSSDSDTNDHASHSAHRDAQPVSEVASSAQPEHHHRPPSMHFKTTPEPLPAESSSQMMASAEKRAQRAAARQLLHLEERARRGTNEQLAAAAERTHAALQQAAQAQTVSEQVRHWTAIGLSRQPNCCSLASASDEGHECSARPWSVGQSSGQVAFGCWCVCRRKRCRSGCERSRTSSLRRSRRVSSQRAG